MPVSTSIISPFFYHVAVLCEWRLTKRGESPGDLPASAVRLCFTLPIKKNPAFPFKCVHQQRLCGLPLDSFSLSRFTMTPVLFSWQHNLPHLKDWILPRHRELSCPLSFVLVLIHPPPHPPSLLSSFSLNLFPPSPYLSAPQDASTASSPHFIIQMDSHHNCFLTLSQSKCHFVCRI